MRAFVLAMVLALGMCTPTLVPATELSLDDPNVTVKVKDIAAGHKLIIMSFVIDEWREGETLILRKYCPPGMLMFNAGFSVLTKLNGQPIPESEANKLRRYVRLNNMRNMVDGQGRQGFSWYIRNDGPTAKNVNLELSFTAVMTEGP